MDKKNTLLGLAFIVAGIGFMFWQASQLPERRETPGGASPAQEQRGAAAEGGGPGSGGADGGGEAAREGGASGGKSGDDDASVEALLAEDAPEDATDAADAAPVTEDAPEEIVTLANPFIEVDFTTRGGAIRQVAFLRTKRGGRDDYVFNREGFLPALSLSLAGRDGGIREFALPYEVESRSDTSVTFRYETSDGLVIRRSYTIAEEENGQDPYVIRHRTEFTNRAPNPKTLSTIHFNLGTARQISESQRFGFNYLNVGRYDGEDADFIEIKKLIGSDGFLGIGASQPKDRITREGRIEWSSVKNQFFAAVLSGVEPGRVLTVYPVEPETSGTPVAEDSGEGASEGPGSPGITGSVGYRAGTVDAGGSTRLDFDFYVGPKEFKRLQALGNEQDLVMQFGFLGFFSKLLLAFMYLIHAVVPSWGWSIVIMTICIKLLFWPLTAKASRSQKRMSKIQGPMAELKEKYKDNPQKMQQETLKLFREHQVNPVAGCLPILIQMPIFLGLFYMLRTASELRYAPFLWVSDLSRPDTIMEIGGFPLNLLPLIMGATMFLQMSMMPTSPTADPMQQKIFKFLPFVFLIFLYNFSSGLVLYWTVQNILTIVQQKITNSQPDEVPAGGGGDGDKASKAKPARSAGPASAAKKTGKGGPPRAKGRAKRKK